MLFDEDCDDIIFWKVIFFCFLFTFILVHLLVFGFKFFSTSTVIAWEPFDIWEEAFESRKKVFALIGSDWFKWFFFLVIFDFSEGDDGYIVEIEDSIDFDPLESDFMPIAASGRSELIPQIFSYEIVLILIDFEL